MFLTRNDVSQAMRISLLEQAIEKNPEKGLKMKDYILKEMSYEQALNMVMNPMAEKFIPAPELEKVFYEFVKDIEEARVTLLEHNCGKRRSLVATLREQQTLFEDDDPSRIQRVKDTVQKGRDALNQSTVGRTVNNPMRSAMYAGIKGATKAGDLGLRAAGAIPAEFGAAGAKAMGVDSEKVDQFMGKHGTNIKRGIGAGVAGAGLYALYRRRKRKEEEARRRAASQGYTENVEEQSSATFDQTLKTNRRPNASVENVDERLKTSDEIRSEKYKKAQIRNKADRVKSDLQAKRDAKAAQAPVPKAKPVEAPAAAPKKAEPNTPGMGAAWKFGRSGGSDAALKSIGASGGERTVAHVGRNAGKYGIGAAALGGVATAAYLAKKRRDKKKQQAMLAAAATMEAVSEMCLQRGLFDDHILALKEAKKWVERAYQH